MSDNVRNIAAIAGKELRSYFASPVAWVMMALFAVIFGRFFVVMLDFYLMESMRSQFGGGASNVNERVIRPLLSNASVRFAAPGVSRIAWCNLATCSRVTSRTNFPPSRG